MINWNTDEEKFKKEDPKGHRRWRLVQLINHGLDGEKLSREEVIRQWPHIKDELAIDARKTVEFLLWGKEWQKEPGLLPDRSNFLAWLRARNLSKTTST